MSIASEITRISNAKAAIKAEIVKKGVDVGDDVKLDGFADKIAAIQTGGGGDGFPNPSYYPMLQSSKDILSSIDFTKYDFNREDAIVVFWIGKHRISTFVQYENLFVYENPIVILNGVKIRQNESFDNFVDGVNWIVAPIKFKNYLAMVPTSCVFLYSESTKSVSTSLQKTTRRRFIYIPNGSVAVNGSYGNTQNNDIVANNVSYITKYSTASSGSVVANKVTIKYDGSFTVPCNYWVQYPKGFSALKSANLASMGTLYPSSFAEFDDSGELVGGFVTGIDSCVNDGQTLTFGSEIKARFTEEQISKIEAAVTAKNWTVAW